VLEIERLRAGYGEVQILRDVSLKVEAGEMVTLVGSNGAGKSTLLNTICGIVRPTAGRVRLDGTDITGWPSEAIVAEGITQVPEGRRLFPQMTVRENLLIGAYRRKGKGPWTLESVYELFPILRERRNNPATALSGGQQQMLTIARTLMGNPEVLLLDEPSEGLAPLVVDNLRQQLGRLKASGLTIVLAEQNVRFVSELGDRVYILEKGMVRYQGTMMQFLADEQVRQAYLAV